MEMNPYEPPTHQVRPKPSWRRLWKRICLVSFCTALFLLVIAKLVAALARNSGDTYWFLILDGLLALGELVSWTMVCIGGIGWIVSRRTPNIDPAPEKS